MILDRYRVNKIIGSGSFSVVLGAEDTRSGLPVALKIARALPPAEETAKREISFLERIRASNRTNKGCCLRLLETFRFRGHLCTACVAMRSDLRRYHQEHGGKGLRFCDVRSIAQALLCGVRTIAKLELIHCDIKPDNVLLDDPRTVRLADFGSALDGHESRGRTPELGSRYYRAPELMIGGRASQASDVWAVGCTLFEIFTGRILFPGADNNDMLRLQMRLCGPISQRMLKRAPLAAEHFDSRGQFVARWAPADPAEVWPAVHASVAAPTSQPAAPSAVQVDRPAVRIQDLLAPFFAAKTKADKALERQFADLLRRCLEVDPQRRPAARVLLMHKLFGF